MGSIVIKETSQKLTNSANKLNKAAAAVKSSKLYEKTIIPKTQIDGDQSQKGLQKLQSLTIGHIEGP